MENPVDGPILIPAPRPGLPPPWPRSPGHDFCHRPGLPEPSSAPQRPASGPGNPEARPGWGGRLGRAHGLFGAKSNLAPEGN